MSLPSTSRPERKISETSEILRAISPRLLRTPEDGRPVVVMMCGIAGAGKSSLAHAIITRYPTFTRLSLDAIVYSRHGLHNIDYSPSMSEQYSDEAEGVYSERLADLLLRKQDVVLDRAFYAKADRHAFKKVVEELGGRWLLVYLRCMDKEALWQRVERRWAGREMLVGVRRGDASLEITREVFDGYWEGWEAPVGAGEVVFDVL